MRYIIYGAGAIGSCYGGLLYKASRNVVLIGRPVHVEAIRKNGLQIICKNETLILPLFATDTLNGVSEQPNDLILLAVKSHQTKEALEDLQKYFSSTIPIIAFQNGVHNEGILSTYFKNVYGALVNFNGNFLSPGIVQRTVLDLIVFGKFPSGKDVLTSQLVFDAREAGFNAHEHSSIVNLKWGKLIINLNNATLALQDLWLQKALSIQDNVVFMTSVIEEGMKVLTVAGIDFSDSTGLYDAKLQLNKMKASYSKQDSISPIDTPQDQRSYPSTWQDLHLGRSATEVYWLNGEIIRLGVKYGISTPYNSVLMEAIETSVKDKLGPGGYTLNDLCDAVKDKEIL